MRPDRDSAEYRHAAWMSSSTAGRFSDTPSPREKVLGGPRPGLRPRHAGHLELFPGVTGYRRTVRRSKTTSTPHACTRPTRRISEEKDVGFHECAFSLRSVQVRASDEQMNGSYSFFRVLTVLATVVFTRQIGGQGHRNSVWRWVLDIDLVPRCNAFVL